jgi:hypothetical protein
MAPSNPLGSLFIGAAGELLVQYQLLKYGVDSARLTTDSGIDLVMYVPGTKEAATIQVKATNDPKPAPGKTTPRIGLIFPDSCKAQWLATADLSRDRVWLMRTEQARQMAQQHRPDGTRALYWDIDTTERIGKPYAETDLDPYILHTVTAKWHVPGERGHLVLESCCP